MSLPTLTESVIDSKNGPGSAWKCEAQGTEKQRRLTRKTYVKGAEEGFVKADCAWMTA